MQISEGKSFRAGGNKHKGRTRYILCINSTKYERPYPVFLYTYAGVSLVLAPSVELLGHRVQPGHRAHMRLISLAMTRLFSTVYQCMFLAAVHKGFYFHTFLPALNICGLCNFCHSEDLKVIHQFLKNS